MKSLNHMNFLFIAAAVAVLFTGCAEYSRYQRPELFHPRSELAKEMLKQLNTSPLNIDGPSGPLVATKDAVYRIFIRDECATAKMPTYTVYPKNGLSSFASLSDRLFYLDIDAEKLKYHNTLEILVRSCKAVDMTIPDAIEAGLYQRRVFQVTPPLEIKDVSVESGVTDIHAWLNIWPEKDTANEFGETFASLFIACDVVFGNSTDKSALIYGSSLTANVRYLPAKEDVQRLFGEKALKHPSMLKHIQDENGSYIGYFDFKESRRPLSFSDILAIFEYQRKGAPRQRLIDGMKSLGELATGAALFISGTDYTKGVAFFTGVFTPEIEKQLLWDVLMHIKNLQERSLKEVEELDASSQIHRVVFFPRRAIYNLIPQMPVYIAEILPHTVSAKATIIVKNPKPSTVKALPH